MFGQIKLFKSRSRALIIATALVFVMIIGFVDYITGQELSFSVFYLFAIGLAAWFVGKGFAFFIAVFSVIVSLGGDLVGGPHYTNLLVPYWNASIVLAVYLVIVWLLTKLRSLQEGLEARVQQRTAALTDEMAERERLERELLGISEREQRRIGQDLHDSLCQHLTGTALAGQVLKEKLMTRGLTEAADAKKVVELIEAGIALSRKLAKGLHPIELDAEGLMEALDELTSTISELFKVSCRFECDSPVLINNPTVSGHLYRIAQEAVSNAVKHGKAKNIVIGLETIENGIALQVKDDGIGLPEPLPKSSGMGLRIMVHRAEMVGAMFSASRDNSGGTIVSCILHEGNKPEQVSP